MTLINVSKLDTTKTYVCCEVGSSPTAKVIQGLEHKVYSTINNDDISSHTFSLVYKDGNWFVWECHARWGGIKSYPLSQYEILNAKSDVKKVYVYPYELNLNAMTYWENNNPGYSMLNLAEITEERLVGLKLPNTQGFICSEAVAYTSLSYDICLKINKPLEEITPVDWQVFMSGKDINN